MTPPSPTDVHDSSTSPLSTDDNCSKRKRETFDDTPPTEDQNPAKPTAVHPLWKTSLCSYFRSKSGACSHGDACRYAHSEEELRQRPDKSWDPTSERVKKVAKTDDDDVIIGSGDEIMMTEAFFDDDDDKNGDSSSDYSMRKCLVNLPKNWSSDEFKTFIDEQGVSCKSAKKKKGMAVGFVSFENAEHVTNAVKVLDGIVVANSTLKVVDVVPQSLDNKSNPSSALEAVDIEEGSTLDCEVSKARTVRDAVTPLAHMTYEEQLDHKKNGIAQMLKKLTRQARKACPNGVSLPQWILKSKEIGGLACKLEGIIESPLVNGYRNKCEFSIGYSLQGKPTVGFMLGNFREGVTAVEEPVDCPNVSVVACKYASIFQEFLQQSSLPVWNRFQNTGFWRQLTVREGREPRNDGMVKASEVTISEVLLMVQVCSVDTDDEIVNSEFERMTQAFTAGSSTSSIPLTALVIQDHKGISNVAPADCPLRSLPIHKENNVVEPQIHDYINNLQFCISPTAFFQVNTLAAEKLYSLAGDWAGLGPDTLLFDVCCGTGTIGLTLAHLVGMVVGIEMNASAVLDATKNAEINGIKNCRFISAKAEDVMGSLLKEYLDVAENPGETLNTSPSNEKSTILMEVKDVTVDNVHNPDESSSPEMTNGKDASGITENGEEEPKDQLQKICSTNGGCTSVMQFKNVVAVVDPPRAGLHPTVIKALRTHPGLRKLVYISCNPETLVANAIELCTPSTDQAEKGNKNNWRWRNMSSAGLARHRTKSMPNSEPFYPVKAMAVDLFPHTHHCEMVMLLER